MSGSRSPGRPVRARTSAASWQGTILVAPGHALYVGRAGDTRPHRHHALQLAVGLEGSLEAQLGSGPLRSCSSLLIAADVEHRIQGRGLPLAIYYADGSSAEGRVLSDWLRADSARTLDAEARNLRGAIAKTLAMPGPSALDFLREHVATVLGYAAPAASSSDPIVEAATSLLEESLAAAGPPALAQRLGIRQRELSARFRRGTGLTIRRYVLWVRLKTAVTALAEHGTLTRAAHAAGFADAAHLSRTFVQMFGVSPSESVAASRIRVHGPTEAS